MLTEFHIGGPWEEGLGYYDSYRCTTVSGPQFSKGMSVAEAENGEDYSIPTRDCLAQVHNVLAAYGAHGMPSDMAVQYALSPNNWYNHLSGWSAKTPLT